MDEDKRVRKSGETGHIGRITWRHGSLLFAIFRGVLRVVNRNKKAQQETKLGALTEKTNTTIQFRSGGTLTDDCVQKATAAKYTVKRALVVQEHQL